LRASSSPEQFLSVIARDEMESWAFVGFILTILFLLDFYLHNYWSRKGFPQTRPSILIGDIADLLLLRKSIAEVYGELHLKHKYNKFVGLYWTYRPGLLVTDKELIHNILVKDFNYFYDHGLYVDAKRDPLSAHLFSLSGDKWKHLRTKLSPLFSPVKLRMMFPTFLDCALNLERFLTASVGKGESCIEIRDLFARYTTDIIASVAFGHDNDSINDPDNIFRKMGSKVFKPSMKSGLRALLTFSMPQLNKLIGIKVADDDVEQFMFAMVKKTIAYREEKNIQRNDFMQMMIKLMNEGSEEERLTIEEVTAQAFVFFIAGEFNFLLKQFLKSFICSI